MATYEIRLGRDRVVRVLQLLLVHVDGHIGAFEVL